MNENNKCPETIVKTVKLQTLVLYDLSTGQILCEIESGYNRQLSMVIYVLLQLLFSECILQNILER